MSLTVGQLAAIITLDDSAFGQSVNRAKATFAGLATTAQAGMDKATVAVEKTSKALEHIEKNRGSFDQLVGGAAKLGAVLTAAAAGAVAVHTNFDKSMSAVKATGDDARKSIDQLREAAIKAGADTSFSASEAAGGIEELSKAGVSAADVLGGGLKGSLDLAAAGEIGVADAAGIASVALTQFKLEGKDVGHVADLLAAGSGKAMGGVDDLGMAFKQGGLLASQYGLSIEETVGGLSAFASAGLLGSDAGTSFKTMLQRLTPTSKEADAQFKSLGISAFDAQGNFVGLADFAGQLQTSMRDLSPEARNAAMNVMFGSDAVRAANVLFDQGSAGIQQWINNVDDAGYAAKTAGELTDNLAGDLEGLGGSFETLMIGMGGGADGVLRAVVQNLDNIVDAANGLPEPLKEWGLLLTGAGGVTALAVAGFGKAIVSIQDTRAALNAMNVSGRAATFTFLGVGAAIGIATIGISMWASKQAEAKAQVDSYVDSLDQATGKISENTRALAVAALEEKRGFFNSRAGKSALDDAEKIGLSLSLVTDAAMGNVDAMKAVDEQTRAYLTNFEGDRLAFDDAKDAVANVTGAIQDQSGSIDEAQRRQQAMTDALGETTEANENVVSTSEAVTSAYEAQAGAADELWDSQNKLVDGVLSLRDAQRQYEQGLDDAKDAAKQAAEDFTAEELKKGAALDITTEKGRANNEILDQRVNDTWALLDAMRAENASEEELQTQMGKSREAFIDTASAMGMGKEAARELADYLHLIPAEVSTNLSVNDRMSSIVDGIVYKLQRLDGRTITTNLVTREQTISSGRSNAIAKADGGSVHGPGTGTSDSIPAWLSNGEHVVTAREVQAMGGHVGVEKWRRMALAGTLPAFATGGAVSSAESDLADVNSRIKKQKKVVKDEKADVKSAQKSYDSIDGTKENRTKKKAAKKRLDKQNKELKSEQKELDELLKNRADLKARISRLKEESEDLSLDVLRGNVTDQFTGGLSGALSVVDDLLAMSQNKDISKKKRKAAGAKAKEIEAAVTAAYSEAEKLEASLAKSKEDVSDLANIQAGVSSVLRGEFGLADSIKAAVAGTETLIQKTNKAGDVWYETQTSKGSKASVTAKDILANANAKVAAYKTFTGKLDKLAAMGISGVILAEIGREGLEGGTLLADALLADPATAKKLNGAYESLDYWTNAAGASATKNTTVNGTFYAGGVNQAEAAVAGIESSLESVYATIEKLASTSETALLSALGLKKDKKGNIVAKADGGPIVGPGTGTSDDVLMWGSNGEHVWTAKEVQAAGGHAGVQKLRQQALTHSLPGAGSTPIVVNRNLRSDTASASGPVNVVVELPTVMVENPWTGEYMEARMKTVAQKNLVSTVSTASRGYSA